MAKTVDRYDEWGKHWAAGMRASSERANRNRVAAQAKATAHRAEGKQRPCGIKGCERHVFKGQMCRKHWAMVPQRSKLELTLACYAAQFDTAKRHHRRMLRELRATLADQPR